MASGETQVTIKSKLAFSGERVVCVLVVLRVIFLNTTTQHAAAFLIPSTAAGRKGTPSDVAQVCGFERASESHLLFFCVVMSFVVWSVVLGAHELRSQLLWSFVPRKSTSTFAFFAQVQRRVFV